MRCLSFLLLSLVGLAGCAENDLRVRYADGFTPSCPPSDGGVAHDLSQTIPTCAAAKGLSGVPLICTDFPSAQTLVDLKGKGWDFTSQCPAGWTVSNSSLQVTGFSTFASTCSFTTRALTASEYQPYNSFTLSVVQTLDVNETQQKAQIMMGQDDPPNRLVDQATGKQPRQQRTYQIAKAALPNGGNNNYQPLFKITSGTAFGAGYQGWQIESIAVMGNP